MKTYIVREDIEEWQPLINWLEMPPGAPKTEVGNPAVTAPVGVE
jgi:hypothetical protein